MTDNTDAYEDIDITRLGHEGDGIGARPGTRPDGAGPNGGGSSGGGMVFVAHTLPGERVRIAYDGDSGGSDRARLVEILTPSPERAAPVCQHFTVCGGCAMQHLSQPAYVAWKTAILTGALGQHGLVDLPLAPMVVAPLGSRRRAILGAKRTAHGVVLGFHEPRGHRILDLAECPVSDPAIVTRLPALRDLVEPLLTRALAQGGQGLRLIVTAVDNGVDVVIEGAGGTLSAAQREELAQAATAARVLRVSLDRDPVFMAAEPMIRFGTVDVVPPPGVFLQAVPAIERAMADDIVAAVGKAKRVVDLFAGIGTFTFPLARRAEVTAVDSDKRAIAALVEANRRGQGVRPVTATVRDLFRDPLAPRELDTYEAIVVDPPRAGAADQAERIARSKVGTVVMVSCAPGTLARDLATLVAGGYRIERMTAYDQFLYATHLETVTVLRRPRSRN